MLTAGLHAHSTTQAAITTQSRVNVREQGAWEAGSS